MKKVIFICVVLFASYTFSNAQELGIRLGNTTRGNAAVDAIFSTGQFNRIHADVSFGDGIGIDALWDFIYRPLPDETFKWYVGVGPYTNLADDFQLGAVGEIGIEYILPSIPLSISADYRPAFELIENTSLHMNGFGINVRWIF